MVEIFMILNLIYFKLNKYKNLKITIDHYLTINYFYQKINKLIKKIYQKLNNYEKSNKALSKT